MKFGCMVSLGDHAGRFGAYGRCGVYHIVNRLRESGLTRLYLRSSGHGMAYYPSRIKQAGLRYDLEEAAGRIESGGVTRQALESINASTDYGAFDHFACARDRTRELGMELVVWEEPRAEDHCCGLRSRFVKRHPQFLSVNRRGQRSPSELSPVHPEVQARRIGLFREVLSYEPDGVFFDWIKSGDTLVGRFDEDGVWEFGYEDAMVAAFRDATGRDPRDIPNNDPQWLGFRAGFVTDYMRAARDIQKALHPDTEIGLLALSPGAEGWHDNLFACRKAGKKATRPVPNPMANLEDHETWISEDLIDAFCCGHNVGDGSVDSALSQVDAAMGAVGRCRLVLEVNTYPLTDEEAEGWAERLFAGAAERGVDEIVFRESCPMWPRPGVWKALAKTTRQYP